MVWSSKTKPALDDEFAAEDAVLASRLVWGEAESGGAGGREDRREKDADGWLAIAGCWW